MNESFGIERDGSNFQGSKEGNLPFNEVFSNGVSFGKRKIEEESSKARQKKKGGVRMERIRSKRWKKGGEGNGRFHF